MPEQTITEQNNASLTLDTETGTYWINATICGKATRLFAGTDELEAKADYKWYKPKQETGK